MDEYLEIFERVERPAPTCFVCGEEIHVGEECAWTCVGDWGPARWREPDGPGGVITHLACQDQVDITASR